MGGKKKLAVLMSSEQQDYLTPPDLLDDVRAVARGFICLDPSTNEKNTTGALHYLTEKSPNRGGFGIWPVVGGLAFSNPTYGRDLPMWAESFCRNWSAGTVAQLIALVPARTDTQWFRRMAGTANAVCFHSRRIHFHDPATGKPVLTWSKKKQKWMATAAPFPSAWFYWGGDVDRFAHVFGKRLGLIWRLGPTQLTLDGQ